jgi:hypothetical protein
MQASIQAPVWALSFCAAYIVPPCKGLEREQVMSLVKGSSVPTDADLNDFLHEMFEESAGKCVVDIAFVADDEEQENPVRTIVRSIALGDTEARMAGAHELACRLASATTHRSRQGLLMVLVGEEGAERRLLLGKFPADESIQASLSDQRINLRLLKDAFSRKSSYFKVAVFDGNPARTSFWRGTVEDRQAKQRLPEAARFWISDFLCVQP